jgi:UDP-glucose 4-epimerase
MSLRRVLVTGANGFIGRACVESLAEAGWLVRAGVRRPPAFPACFPAGVETMILGDVADLRWPAALAGMDAVVHCAAIAHARGVAPADYMRVNLEPVRALAQAAEGRRVVLLSSIRALEADARPHDVYAQTKLAAEEALFALAPQACALRSAPVYGPGARYNMRALEWLARSLAPLPFGALEAPLSLVSLGNVASAVRFALETPALSGACLLADPEPASLPELVRAFRHALGRPALVFPAPLGALRLGARALGARRLLDTLTNAGPVCAPDALLAAGWRPAHAHARAGAADWALRRRG